MYECLTRWCCTCMQRFMNSCSRTKQKKLSGNICPKVQKGKCWILPDDKHYFLFHVLHKTLYLCPFLTYHLGFISRFTPSKQNSKFYSKEVEASAGMLTELAAGAEGGWVCSRIQREVYGWSSWKRKPIKRTEYLLLRCWGRMCKIQFSHRHVHGNGISTPPQQKLRISVWAWQKLSGVFHCDLWYACTCYSCP